VAIVLLVETSWAVISLYRDRFTFIYTEYVEEFRLRKCCLIPYSEFDSWEMLLLLLLLLLVLLFFYRDARQGEDSKFTNRLKYGEDPSKGLVSKTGWLAEAGNRKLTVTFLAICYRVKLTEDTRRSIFITLHGHYAII